MACRSAIVGAVWTATMRSSTARRCSRRREGAPGIALALDIRIERYAKAPLSPDERLAGKCWGRRDHESGSRIAKGPLRW